MTTSAKFEKELWSVVHLKGVSKKQKKQALKKLAEIKDSKETKK